MLNLHEEIALMGEKAQIAAHQLTRLNARKKNTILQAMADGIEAQRDPILEANEKDMQEGRNAGLNSALLDRLLLSESRMISMVKGLRAVADLKDPIGSRICRWIRPNGLEICKIRVPIGVIAVIYESRPNVTADTAGLCIKTSNAIILRGGKESIHSNTAIANAMTEGGKSKGLPENAVQLVQTTDRDAVRELVQLEGKIDLVMPRGGEALIRAVTEQARVPVIKHFKGVCHVYVDESANLDMALSIVENAKCQRPGVCNAMEHLLIHEKVAAQFLPMAAAKLRERGVLLKGDPVARAILPDLEETAEDEWGIEYLDKILSIRVVPSVQEAVEHINTHGSRHSDAIVTETEAARKLFVQEVDSAAVYVNASTRFTDGGEFGMGAEIGISTDKIHARGPMGLEELTTYKYVVLGKGQIRE